MVKIVIAATICGGLIAAEAEAYPTQNDVSPGMLGLQYGKRANVWSRLDFAIVDAKVTSSPPDIAKLDRRVDALFMVGADKPIGTRFGARLHLVGAQSLRRQAEEEGPPSQVDETIYELEPAADLTFVTDKGLEIFLGLSQYRIPKYTQTVTTDTTESKTKYGEAVVMTRRVGVVRRAGLWSGAVYYQIGDEDTRSFSKSASDGTSVSGTEVVYRPSQIGVLGNFDAASIAWDVELTFVQARGKGPRDENGNTITADHSEFKVGGKYPFGPQAIKFGLYHRTLSYSSNAYMSLDTIPITSGHLRWIYGSADAHGFVGLIGAYGRDGQSLPEFNADYELTAYGVSGGFFLPF